MRRDLPGWAEYGLLPLLNLAAALLLTILVFLAIGEDPLAALSALVLGAAGDGEAIGYTLFYATGFVFTGLAVAIPLQAGLFNIGGEGQAYVGGLGATLVALTLGDAGAPPWLALALAVLGAALFGAAWAFVPAWLQARRGSHVVITTIMFNFIAGALMTHLLVNVLIAPGQSAPESRGFAPSLWLPTLADVGAAAGLALPRTPLNLALPLALLCAALAWVLIGRTRCGYEIRAIGLNETAARCAGIDVPGRTILALLLGGACAGLMAVNDVMGSEHRLLLDFPAGAGFVGIAVALMGRGHPLGICLAALLFGALAQGGAELSFEIPTIRRDLIVVIEGLAILLCGAFEGLFRPAIAGLLPRLRPGRHRKAAA